MQLWRLLEDRTCWAGVASEWKRWLGCDPSVIARWLRPREELARSIPDADGRWLRIVEHGDDDVVGIEDDAGTSVAVETDQRVVHELDVDRLLADIAAAIPLEGGVEHVVPRVWCIGRHEPVAGRHFPFVLAVPSSPAMLLSAVGIVAARTRQPFVIVTPTDRHFGEQSRSLLRDRESAHVSLDSLMAVSTGGLSLALPIGSILSGFFDRHLAPQPGTSAARRFATPTNATWSNVSIHFHDREKVTVSVLGVTRLCTFTDMGMAHTRSRKPSVAWDLLWIFAQEKGELRWNGQSPTRKNQKRRERLAAALQQFFGIASDPIAYDPSLGGWRLRFTVSGAWDPATSR